MHQRIEIIGYLGADPELKYFPSGDAVCNIRVACAEKWKDKQTGEPREHSEWFRVAIRKGAENAAKFLRKGSLVFVDGRQRTRSYQKDGQTLYMIELIADNWRVLKGGKSDSAGNEADHAGQPAQQEIEPTDDAFNDDIPF